MRPARSIAATRRIMRSGSRIGTPVHAPAAGRVVSSANDVADNRLDNGRLIPARGGRSRAGMILGNHVVIDHENGEYSFLAHLRAGTVTVKPGDVVAARPDCLEQIGFSGDTGAHVHLHYHLANGVDLREVERPSGVLSSYRRLLGSSAVDVRDGLLHTGDIVRRSER